MLTEFQICKLALTWRLDPSLKMTVQVTLLGPPYYVILDKLFIVTYIHPSRQIYLAWYFYIMNYENISVNHGDLLTAHATFPALSSDSRHHGLRTTHNNETNKSKTRRVVSFYIWEFQRLSSSSIFRLSSLQIKENIKSNEKNKHKQDSLLGVSTTFFRLHLQTLTMISKWNQLITTKERSPN